MNPLLDYVQAWRKTGFIQDSIEIYVASDILRELEKKSENGSNIESTG